MNQLVKSLQIYVNSGSLLRQLVNTTKRNHGIRSLLVTQARNMADVENGDQQISKNELKRRLKAEQKAKEKAAKQAAAAAAQPMVPKKKQVEVQLRMRRSLIQTNTTKSVNNPSQTGRRLERALTLTNSMCQCH